MQSCSLTAARQSLIRAATLVLVVALGLTAPAGAADRAGTAAELSGEVRAEGAGGARTLAAGDTVFAEETLRTGAGSSLTLILADQTKFQLGPNAAMTLDSFVFDGTKGKMSTKLLKGAFRFVSGGIAKAEPASMIVSAPFATIGVRGTAVIAEISTERNSIALVEPEGDARPTSIQVANAAGSVVIDQPGFGTDVDGADKPPSPPYRWDSERVRSVIGTLQTLQRLNVPILRR